MLNNEESAGFIPAMAAPASAPAKPILTRQAQAWAGLGRRLAGPGGFYNVGNALGLLGGIALHVVALGAVAGHVDLRVGAAAALDYLAGSASAAAITLAMLVFFWSGEAYHRAWARSGPPDLRLNRLGDLLSGYGALILGFGLFLIGEPLLAATAGFLHAVGKLGSAWHNFLPARLTRLRPDPFRSAVLVSRLPAILLVIIEISRGVSQNGSLLAAPSLLLVCYLLWARADLLLYGSGD